MTVTYWDPELRQMVTANKEEPIDTPEIVEVLKKLRDDIDVVSRNTDTLGRGDREARLRHDAYFEGIDFALAKIDALIKERE